MGRGDQALGEYDVISRDQQSGGAVDKRNAESLNISGADGNHRTARYQRNGVDMEGTDILLFRIFVLVLCRLIFF